jgi:hypothetical protein
MELPDLLRENGVDPEDFLRRTKEYWDYVRSTRPDAAWYIPVRERHVDTTLEYVDRALHWESQSEGYDFWATLHAEWRMSEPQARWPALEVALGWVGPLEAELLEVKDEAT